MDARKRSQVLLGSSWLIAERIAGAFVGIGVLVLLSRHMGPEDMGRLGLAQSLLGLAAVAANLGLDVILIRDLVRAPQERDRLLGTVATMQLMAGLVCAALLFVALALSTDDPKLLILTLFMSITLFGIPLAVIESYLSAQNRMREQAVVRTVSYLALPLSAAALVVANAPLIWFALPFIIQAAVRVGGMVLLYKRDGLVLRRWTTSTESVRQLFASGLPLMISAVAVALYATVDRVMVNWLAGPHATGEYFVAAKLSEGWHFLPMAAIAAAFPDLVRAREQSAEMFAQAMQRLLNIMVMLAVAIALPISLFAEWIVVTLYSSEYRGAAEVLRIHVWSNVLVFLGVASGRWLILEGYAGQYLARTLAGVVANIGLNFALIPRMGAVGAAIAIVLAQVVVVFLADIAFPSSWPMLRMKLRAFLPVQNGRL